MRELGNVTDTVSYKYTEPKWNIYTFIIKIANTISNECISLCLYKIGHVGNNMS